MPAARAMTPSDGRRVTVVAAAGSAVGAAGGMGTATGLDHRHRGGDRRCLDAGLLHHGQRNRHRLFEGCHFDRRRLDRHGFGVTFR